MRICGRRSLQRSASAESAGSFPNLALKNVMIRFFLPGNIKYPPPPERLGVLKLFSEIRFFDQKIWSQTLSGNMHLTHFFFSSVQVQ